MDRMVLLKRLAVSSNVTLEPITTDDAESLAALRVQAMQESLERIGRFDPARARARFLDTFSPEYTRAIIHDGERIGFIVVRPHDEELLLDHLYVQPSHQNRGIGAETLQIVFAEADACSATIRVGALRGSRSNQFYLAHGFELVEQAEFDNYYVRMPKSAAPMREAS
jgi:GNAT superfamily N-acetyltransferase